MVGYPNSQANPASAIPVWIAPAPAASGVSPKFVNLSATGNTQVKTGAGTLSGVSVNSGVSGATVALYDGTSTAGTQIATIDASVPNSLAFAGLPFSTGLFAVVTAESDAPNVTLIYS